MARIRANGVPQDEDFSKGSKSFELQSETLRALNDLIKQRDSVINSLNERLNESLQSLASQGDQSEKSSEEKISILSSQIAKLKFELSDNLKERDEARDLLCVGEERDEAVWRKIMLGDLELEELDEARQISKELDGNVLELKFKLEDKCKSYDDVLAEFKALKVDLHNVKTSLLEP